MQSTSESLLVRLRSERDTDAWARFVELYTPLIFYWARKTGLQSQDASDLVQEVLTQVYRKLPEFNYDRSGTFRGWLRMVTLNKYRERRRRMSLNVVDATQSALGQIADPQMAESTWDVDYARILVARAMEMMKPDFAPETWVALKLMMTTGRPPKEIAAEQSISVWTLYSARNRLMSRLRSELEGLL